MAQQGVTPNPLGQRDAAARIGLAAVLEGHLLVGDLDPHVVGTVSRHLQMAGLVEPGARPAEVRLALANLNQRLRYVLGEYDKPPAPDTGQVDLYCGFASEAAALAFAEAGAARSESAAPPVAVDGRAYDGDVSWQVAVRITELPLTDEFDQRPADHARHGVPGNALGSRCPAFTARELSHTGPTLAAELTGP